MPGFDYAVLGLGKTGLAVLSYLAKHEPDKRILASDSGNKPDTRARALAANPKAEVETESHSNRVLDAREVIKSPGLHPGLPILKKLFESGVQVHSEIQFAQSRFASKPANVLAVTGTNGKTTVTHMLGHILKSSGKETITAGNIGSPLIAQADAVTRQTHLALELSSYQLEDSKSLLLDAAVIMNLTPDHLDHHGTWEKYVEAKAKILSFIRSDGTAILNFEDAACRKMPKGPWRLLFFSSKRALKEGAWMEKGRIRFKTQDAEGILEPCPGLFGEHNSENQMAAVLAVLSAGVLPAAMEPALARYQPPPHRLERVREAREVLFINDSKATNVESALVALKAVSGMARDRKGKIHLLLGGLDKGSSYLPLAEFKGCPLAFYAYGSAASKITSETGCPSFPELQDACRAAFDAARPGDVILLSPACASFDQFANFEDRGEQFRAIAAGLAQGA